MSCPYIHLSRYAAHFISGNTVNPFVIYADVPIYSCDVMNGSMNKKGAGYPSGVGVMIAFWRAIMTMKTSKTGVATARHILPFCKKQDTIIKSKFFGKKNLRRAVIIRLDLDPFGSKRSKISKKFRSKRRLGRASPACPHDTVREVSGTLRGFP